MQVVNQAPGVNDHHWGIVLMQEKMAYLWGELYSSLEFPGAA